MFRAKGLPSSPRNRISFHVKLVAMHDHLWVHLKASDDKDWPLERATGFRHSETLLTMVQVRRDRYYLGVFVQLSVHQGIQEMHFSSSPTKVSIRAQYSTPW